MEFDILDIYKRETTLIPPVLDTEFFKERFILFMFTNDAIIIQQFEFFVFVSFLK